MTADTTTPPDVEQIGFTPAELDHLLSFGSDPVRKSLAAVLNVGPPTETAETLSQGGASLLVRGLSQFVDGGTLQLVGPANAVSRILGTAQRWSLFGIANGTTQDSGLFVEAVEGKLLAQPRALGTWWFILIDPDAAPEDVITETAMGLARSTVGDWGLIVKTMSVEHDRSFTVQKKGDTWGYAAGITAADTPELLVEDASADEVAAQLSAFVAAWPSPMHA